MNNISIMKKYDGRYIYIQDRSQNLMVIDTHNSIDPEKGGLYLWKMGSFVPVLNGYDITSEKALKIIGVDLYD